MVKGGSSPRESDLQDVYTPSGGCISSSCVINHVKCSSSNRHPNGYRFNSVVIIIYIIQYCYYYILWLHCNLLLICLFKVPSPKESTTVNTPPPVSAQITDMVTSAGVTSQVVTRDRHSSSTDAGRLSLLDLIF